MCVCMQVYLFTDDLTVLPHMSVNVNVNVNVCVYESKRIVELPSPYTFAGVSSCGYAGGIGPGCIGEILSLVEAAVGRSG